MSEYWQVVLSSPPFAVLTYARPSVFPALVPGMRVLVPMRGGLRAAVCIASCPKPTFATKPLIWPLEREPVLDADWLAMAQSLSSRQLVPLGRVLSVLLPQGLRTAQVSYGTDGSTLPKVIKPKHIQNMDEVGRAALLEAWEDGQLNLRLNPRKEAEARVVALVADPPWPVRPAAVRQAAVLEYLYEHGKTTVGILTRELGSGTCAIVERLVKSELVRWDEQSGELATSAASAASFVSSPEQDEAIKSLCASMEEWAGNTGVIHGITGSGKTHVYLSLAKRALDAGRSCLLLAPEVALAMSLMQAVSTRLGPERTCLYHGYQNPNQRQQTFLKVAQAQQPMVVVGTRSALFLPLRNLGLVVLDEEHDESFKQEERLAYQAKEVAWSRVRRCGGMLVLGSATPDIKTFYATQSGNVPLVSMPSRVGEGKLPEVVLADISQLASQDAPLAPEVAQELTRTVEEGQQVMVMLNRRGYSPVMYCLDCGEAAKCPSCDVGLTYHKGRERLICHYCGLSVPYPALCSGCGSSKHLPMGGGTERIEEYLTSILPEGTTVLRMDRDSTRRQERMEEILQSFAKGEAQVLVGTQMLSKGHHFPNVTLVVVADGDLGLNLPDYRCSERTFQLLVQVSGRAGRGEKPGQVIIQTRNPKHPFWADVLAADYHAFYASEIKKRERFGYPPFSKLALVRLSHAIDDQVSAGYLTGAASVLREAAGKLGVSVLGPAPAPLSRLRNRRRLNCMLKGSDWDCIRNVFLRLRAWNPNPEGLRITLDLDPVNML